LNEENQLLLENIKSESNRIIKGALFNSSIELLQYNLLDMNKKIRRNLADIESVSEEEKTSEV
jgi:hypothetical protein